MRFEPEPWLQVRMDKGPDGPARARHFFNAAPDAVVEEIDVGYKVEAARCRPGAANDWWK